MSVLSVGVPEMQAASPVMATEAIPKPLAALVASMEAVPELTSERAPVTTFSPRRAVGLMSGPERASDSEPSPERAPVPVDSPERAPVPELSPRRAPVPEFSPISFPEDFFWGGGSRAPAVVAGPRDEAKATEAAPPWRPDLPWVPERAPLWRPLRTDTGWQTPPPCWMLYGARTHLPEGGVMSGLSCVLFPLCSLMPLFGPSCFLSPFSSNYVHLFQLCFSNYLVFLNPLFPCLDCPVLYVKPPCYVCVSCSLPVWLYLDE